LSFPEAVFLGILQGLTEFLPVSSSGHLVIAQGFLPGFEQPGVLFDLVLHGGTLVAVVFFLRKEVSEILRALPPLPPGGTAAGGESGRAVHRKMFFLLIAATVVTALTGWPFRDGIAGLFESPTAAAFLLLVTGLLLFFADRVQNTLRTKKDLNVFDALIIGFAQALALLPGLSRSGATISFALFRKIRGETAATFSFLMSIPAVAGAILLEAWNMPALPEGALPVYGAGFFAAMVTGFLALKMLYLFIKKHRLRVFSYYCWVAGSLTLVTIALK